MVEEQIEFEEPLEEDVSGAYKEKKIYIDKGDPDISSLYRNYKDGKLILQPDFQRYFVWDMKKASRLIESILLEIPLPTIYTSQEQDNKEYVIDGQQRLTSLFSFMDGKFPDGRDFQLTNLEALTDLNKKPYTEIGETNQDKIKGYYIRKIMFKKESDSSLKFEIFKRLNTGAVSLNYQELRNCVYRGAYNNFIRDLAEEPDFRYLFNLNAPEKRMRDVELVLRFLSFYNATYLNYKPPIKDFLNEDMRTHSNMSKADMDKLKSAFKNAISTTKSIFDNKAFKRFYGGYSNDSNGWWGTKFNASLYDIIMYEFAREDKNKIYQNSDPIREALIYLMTTDQDFVRAIEISTSGEPSVTTRFDKWRHTVQNIIGIAQKEPRCFSSALKKELWDKNPTCAICNNEIRSIDDAHIDHIEQYWQGGKTIPENARLTHRYCNLSRPRKED
jgi:uncharacterized protein with ParB-like and HNH nuclease domain